MNKVPDANDRNEILSWAFEYQMALHELEQEFQSKEGNNSEVLNITAANGC